MYVFNNQAEGFILDYPSGKLVTTISTSMLVNGTCSDDRGDVFASGLVGSQTATVEEYSYGANSPSASEAVQGWRARACSADGTSGNVAAILETPAGNYSVAVFPGFRGRAELYTYSALPSFVSVGYDGGGDLFLLGTAGGYKYGLAELPKGGGSFGPISLNLGENVVHVRTVQWDGTYLTVEATVKAHGKPKDYPQEIFRLTVSGSKAKVVDAIGFERLTGVALPGTTWIQSNRAIMLSAWPTLNIWGYPLGGRRLKHFPSKIFGGEVYFGTVTVPATRFPRS